MTATLMQGDCCFLMKDIPDGSIDLILCDLPFGTTRNAWDKVIPFHALWSQYTRIIKEHGAILLFSQMPFTADVVKSKPELFRYEWIWLKTRASGHLNANRAPLKSHESILVFYKKLPTYNPQMRTGFKAYTAKSGRASSNYGAQRSAISKSDGTRYPIDVLEFAPVNSTAKEKCAHSTQKPVDLLSYLTRTYTNPGDTVLDNCMGSGSTGVAALATGRKFIDMEQNAEFFSIASKRISDLDLVLYGETPTLINEKE